MDYFRNSTFFSAWFSGRQALKEGRVHDVKLTPQANLESLRKEAKRWLKALRAGDPQAMERLATIHPGHNTPSLRTVQHALALEHGFPSWAALKRELEERAIAARSQADRVRLFLEKSANRYSVAPASAQWNTYEPDKPVRGELAARLLARHPEIVRDSIHTAVAAHDLEAVQEFLKRDPAAANQPGGPDGWTPLLRLAYTRMPIDALNQNAVKIATALLDHGADPNAAWSDGQNSFTVLTGLIGGGEGGQTAHPQAEALARLVIERGADPFDPQALYNTSLGDDSTAWLDLLWSESNKRGEARKWTTPAPQHLAANSPVDTGSPSPRSDQRFFGLRSRLCEMTAFADSEDLLRRAVVLLQRERPASRGSRARSRGCCGCRRRASE